MLLFQSFLVFLNDVWVPEGISNPLSQAQLYLLVCSLLGSPCSLQPHVPIAIVFLAIWLLVFLVCLFVYLAILKAMLRAYSWFCV